MKKIFTILSLSLAITATAQFEGAKQVYEAPNLTAIVNTHKTVAILPFEVQYPISRFG